MKAIDKVQLLSKVSCRNDLLLKFINNANPTIIDVGANEGQTAEEMLKLFSGASIYSFEPGPEAFNILKDKFGNSSSVSTEQIALTNFTGEANFHINNNSETNSLMELEEDGFYSQRGIKSIDIVKVQTMRLDDYCKEKNITKIDYLKVDAHGATQEILEGAQEILKKGDVKIVQVELILGNFYTRPDSLYQIEKIMHDCGYKMYTIINSDSHQIGHFYYDYETGQAVSFDVIYIRA